MKPDTPPPIATRPAVSADAAGIARVHIASWQTSYRGLVPDEVLDHLSFERRLEYWQQVLAGGAEAEIVLVAENQQGEVVGFVAGGKSREAALPFAGELYAIYLLETAKRQGIGARLFRQFAKALQQAGYSSMMLWVFAENIPGRRFYEKMGGRYLTGQTLTIGGRDLLEVAYGWDSLAAIPPPGEA